MAGEHIRIVQNGLEVMVEHTASRNPLVEMQPVEEVIAVDHKIEQQIRRDLHPLQLSSCQRGCFHDLGPYR